MKNPEIFLRHILDSIAEIENYTGKISSEKFYHTTQAQDAVIRRLEIIGEAVKNIPTSFRNKYPKIPWAKNVLNICHLEFDIQISHPLTPS